MTLHSDLSDSPSLLATRVPEQPRETRGIPVRHWINVVRIHVICKLHHLFPPLTSREQCAVQFGWSFTCSSSLQVSAKVIFGLPGIYTAVEGVQ